MIKRPVVDMLMRVPSKLSLMNADGGECHLTRWLEAIGEEDLLEKWEVNIQVRILNFALAFFSWIRYAVGLKILLSKTVIFLDFQILHRRNKSFCFNFKLWEDCIVCRHCERSWHPGGENCMETSDALLLVPKPFWPCGNIWINNLWTRYHRLREGKLG